jgi:formate-dependent phosphoribosylglycinamide formyltransferase (GAR transformylase)
VNVIFLEPSFPDNQKHFARALHDVGAAVIGIGERPKDWLDDDVRGWLTHYEQVPSVVDEGRLIDTVRWVQSTLWVDRLEATIEAHVMAAARAREACGIPGTSVHTTWLCRDKPAMKDALRAAGIPCARSAAAGSGDDIRAFAAEVGFPMILKPAAGAGASGAERVNSADDLDAAIGRSGVDQGAPVAAEEFIDGHEGFYDTITIDGRIVLEFVAHYYPNVLEAMRTRWISPQIVATNRLDAPAYAELRELGQRVVEALGIGTSATHMEWFAGSKGLYFSEIGCRPPGVRFWDVYAAANELDIYREWANAIVHGTLDRKPSRRFAGGMIALRPDRDGTIRDYVGIETIHDHAGEWVIDAHFPPPGTPTQPVEAGYMANAWVRMRHPDYDTLRAMLDDVGRTIKVHAA